MDKIKAVLYAIMVSEITCKGEADLRGRDKPRYGSVRFMITHAQIGGTIYKLDRFTNVGRAGKLLNIELDEERIILETSLVLEQGVIVDRHKHVTGLVEGTMYALPLVQDPYVRKGHKSHVIQKDGKNILTYFLKAWGDYIQNLEEVTNEEKCFLETEYTISPADLVSHFLSHLTLNDLVLVS